MTRCWVAVAAAATVAGCSAAPRPTSSTSTVPVCKPTESWTGSQCRPLSSDLTPLRRGEKELKAFNPDRAASELERAKSAGPYRHRDHIRVYEQLSVAYAYLGNEKKALESFEMVLALEPGHAISYTLSPQATFLFERARKQASRRAEPAVRVTWPRNLEVTRPVPVEVEVVADPKTFLSRARLFARRSGTDAYTVYDVDLPRSGEFQRVVLPAIAPEATEPVSLDLYLAAYDEHGNEVLLWGSPDRPRSIDLVYEPPTPWYKKWWVWTIAGTAVALGTGITVYAVTREPGSTVDGDVSIR